MTNTKSEIAVTFNPQEWVDGPYHLDDGADKQLTPAENREPVTFEIPWEDGTDEEGTVFPDESYEANQLQSHPAAPGGSEIGMGHTTFGQNRLPTSNGQLTEQIKYLENSRSEPWPLKSHAGRVDTF